MAASFYPYALWGIVLLAPAIFALLLQMDAPYGHASRSGFGPSLPNRLGWLLMELPAVLSFAYFFIHPHAAPSTAAWILAALWMLHYLHRSFIYPWTLPANSPAMPLLIVASGGIFNTVNGFLQGYFITHLAPHLQADWLRDGRFYLGLAIFACGYALNKHSDYLLKQLAARCQPGEMKIPYGGGFRWVSQPNYLGELLTWAGFAIAAWSPAAWAFVLFTFANLGPRAKRKHAWYQTQFEAYPKTRKALLPGLW